jgi:hypothetical protein
VAFTSESLIEGLIADGRKVILVSLDAGEKGFLIRREGLETAVIRIWNFEL